MDLPLLERPAAAQIQFDYKSGKSPEGWPLELIKAGTLSGLVSYACFYAARQARPQLVREPHRMGIDIDFCKVFWTMLPTFTTPRDVIMEMSKLLDAGWAAGDASITVQVCEALVVAINPVNRMFLWLSEHHRSELLYGATTIIQKIKEYAEGSGMPESPDVLAARHRSVSDGRVALDLPMSSLDADVVVNLEHQVEIAKIALDISSGSGQASPAPTTTVLAILTEALNESTPGAPADAAAVLKAKERMSLRPSSTGMLAEALVPSAALSTVTGVKLDLRSKYAHLWGAPYTSIAAQWTYIEHHLFRAVPVGEWLACGWDKPRYEHAADAIRRYIDHFNATSLWVTAEVLSQDSPEERAAMIVRFIKVAVLLLRYNNFSALVALALGLRREPIARLEKTWALVPAAAMERLHAVYAITDDKKNYRAYKEALKMVPPSAPVVPHLGAHTAELTMQDQLLPTEVSGPGNDSMLHFRRFRELYKLTMPLVDMQENGYEGTELPPVVPCLINMLNTAVVAFSFAFDEDRDGAVVNLEKRSKTVEPPRKPAPAAVDGPAYPSEDNDAGGDAEDLYEYAAGEEYREQGGWVTRAKSFFSADRK